MLRVCWPHPEAAHEAEGLRAWNGAGAVRVHQASALAEGGIRLLRALPRTGGGAVLLHADLHAGNVLAAEREPWLAIDPKPCIGDPACDVTRRIFNAVLIEGADAGARAARMAHLLDLDLSRIRLWLFARAVEASPCCFRQDNRICTRHMP